TADEPCLRERIVVERKALVGRIRGRLLPRGASIHANVPAGPVRRRLDVPWRLDRHIRCLGTRHSRRCEACRGGNQKTFLPHGGHSSFSRSFPLQQSASVPSGRNYRSMLFWAMSLKNNIFYHPLG